ncbi:hypothetical protein LQT97_21825 [Brucella pseudogrignonensis]|uniref:hypothetical protein n=1 Tax=Brucella pseudogrignonensis TaxID=419475 RepID=UPI0007DAAF65|nr:hypothetical protein [Brucella pseudogrignonensis]ANG99538.1 hypothetical protein A8A54_22235 [Brucella pseudogrignonensis]MCD4513874.1 hypothetical protein [Brucella pseudogrignonensis]
MTKSKNCDGVQKIKRWTLPAEATLGSAVRAKGILQHIRARLPLSQRKSIELEAGTLCFCVPVTPDSLSTAAIQTIQQSLQDIHSLPIIPREIEDILSITASERHRWLKDGRLVSAGLRTVKLRGRAKKISFHVYEPRFVEDILDRAAPDLWRVQDRETATENRRRAAAKAKHARAIAKKAGSDTKPDASNQTPQLRGWEEFDADGFLK